MAVLTRSSSEPNGLARASVVAGALGVAALPLAALVVRSSADVRLLHAGIAVPVAGALGIAALLLASRARRRTERTLGRVGGERATRVGRAFGALAVYLAVTGALALGFFALLKLFAS